MHRQWTLDARTDKQMYIYSPTKKDQDLVIFPNWKTKKQHFFSFFRQFFCYFTNSITFLLLKTFVLDTCEKNGGKITECSCRSFVISSPPPRRLSDLQRRVSQGPDCDTFPIRRFLTLSRKRCVCPAPSATKKKSL